MAEFFKNKSGDRVKVAFFPDVERQHFGKIVQRHPVGDQKGAIRAGHDLGLFIHMFGEFACDRPKHIIGVTSPSKPFEVIVFVIASGGATIPRRWPA